MKKEKAKQLHALQETRRVWTAAAKSDAPWAKHYEQQYDEYFDCPACKYHGNSWFTPNCPGNCILSGFWGSNAVGACEDPHSPYRKWVEYAQPGPHSAILWSPRKVRSAAWRMVRGIDTEIKKLLYDPAQQQS